MRDMQECRGRSYRMYARPVVCWLPLARPPPPPPHQASHRPLDHGRAAQTLTAATPEPRVQAATAPFLRDTAPGLVPRPPTRREHVPLQPGAPHRLHTICSSSLTLSAILGCPLASHCRKVASWRARYRSRTPTAAWAHWAPGGAWWRVCRMGRGKGRASGVCLGGALLRWLASERKACDYRALRMPHRGVGGFSNLGFLGPAHNDNPKQGPWQPRARFHTCLRYLRQV